MQRCHFEHRIHLPFLIMSRFTPLYEELEGLVRYEDEEVRELMTRGKFENCEMKSVVVDVPI